ncbi:MAG TPA: tetratricopeptide repeat protein [Mycobacteriales bacterium]|nr:tetratricopeptide repeat protein [Mycobacteriales bacterium]
MPGHPLYAALIVALGLTVASCSGSSPAGRTNTTAATLAAALQLQQQGNLDQARQLYLQVIKAQPNNVYAHYDLGVMAQSAGDDTGALADYRAALTANPAYVPALYNEATIYAKSDSRLAMRTYQRVIALQPVAPTAELNLGLLEIRQGAPHAGIQHLAVAVNEEPALLTRVPGHLRSLVRSVARSVRSKAGPSASADPSAAP